MTQIDLGAANPSRTAPVAGHSYPLIVETDEGGSYRADTASSSTAKKECLVEGTSLPTGLLARLQGSFSGIVEMDELHRDFLLALADISAHPDEDLVHTFPPFVSFIERVFRQEETWMEEIDSPAQHTHLEQHARVLGALHNAHLHLMEGDSQLGRRVIDYLLPQWFSFHASTLDAVLALAMQVKRAETSTLSAPAS